MAHSDIAGKNALSDGIARGIVRRDTSPIPEIGREIARALAGQRAPSSLLTAGGDLQSAALLAMAGRRAEADAQLGPALAVYRGVGATRYVREGEALLAASA